MSEDTKVCPLCAETIKAAARKCRFCGEMLETGAIPSRATAVSSKAVSPQYSPDAASADLSNILAGLTLAAGVLLFVYAMNMDTSVALPSESAAILGYDRVNNIGLMAQQANYRNAGGFIGLVGLIWLLFNMNRRPLGPSGPILVAPAHVSPAFEPAPPDEVSEEEVEEARRSLELLKRRHAPSFDFTSLEPRTRQLVYITSMAIVFLCGLVVYSSTSSARPSRSPVVGATASPLARAGAEAEAPPLVPVATPDAEKVRKNQCFHRDESGNRDCAAPQSVGLMCDRHAPLREAAPEPETAPVVEVKEYTYEDYLRDHPEPVYVSGNVDQAVSYPQTNPDSIDVPHKDGACYYHDSNYNYTCRRQPTRYSIYCAKHGG